VGEEEMLSMIENKRPVDKKNDYYRLQGLLHDHENEVSSNEDYEIVRVKRKKEDEPVWWEMRDEMREVEVGLAALLVTQTGRGSGTY